MGKALRYLECVECKDIFTVHPNLIHRRMFCECCIKKGWQGSYDKWDDEWATDYREIAERQEEIRSKGDGGGWCDTIDQIWRGEYAR